MNENIRESLSALMDGEADEMELRRILKQMPEEPGIATTWQRYHLMRSSLRQEAHSRPAVDLLSGIHTALQNEPYPERDDHASRPVGGFMKYLSQGAIAASVAVVVLITAESVTTLQNDGANMGMATATADSGAPAIATTTGDFDPGELNRMASFAGEVSSLEDEARDRLRQAVFREFEEMDQPMEIPVNYTPQQ